MTLKTSVNISFKNGDNQFLPFCTFYMNKCINFNCSSDNSHEPDILNLKIGIKMFFYFPLLSVLSSKRNVPCLLHYNQKQTWYAHYTQFFIFHIYSVKKIQEQLNNEIPKFCDKDASSWKSVMICEVWVSWPRTFWKILESEKQWIAGKFKGSCYRILAKIFIREWITLF